MAKFSVTVFGLQPMYRTIEVEAATREAAESLAVDKACDLPVDAWTATGEVDDIEVSYTGAA